MYNNPNMYQSPYNAYTPMNSTYSMYQCPYFTNPPMYSPDLWNQFPNQFPPYTNQVEDSTPIVLKDYGPNPFVVNINEAARQNNNYRLALWTGKHLQLTLMSLNVGEDIGLEMHSDLDQFIRIEAGHGLVKMGSRKDKLDIQANVHDDFAFVIPAGTWHNLINTGNTPLKLYSIYAPAQHPFGTVHPTKASAHAAENH